MKTINLYLAFLTTAVVVLTFVLLTTILSGGGSRETSQSDGVSLKTRSLEIVDANGKVCAKIEGPCVKLFSESGDSVIEIGIDHERGKISIANNKRLPLIEIGSDDDNAAGIVISSENGRVINIGRDKSNLGNCLSVRKGSQQVLGMCITPSETGGISVMGKNKGKYALSTLTWGGFGIFNNDYQPVLEGMVTDEGRGMLYINDNRGEARIRVGDWPGDGPKLEIIGTNNKPSVEIKTVGPEGFINISSVMGRPDVSLRGGSKLNGGMSVRDSNSDGIRVYGITERLEKN